MTFTQDFVEKFDLEESRKARPLLDWALSKVGQLRHRTASKVLSKNATLRMIESIIINPENGLFEVQLRPGTKSYEFLIRSREQARDIFVKPAGHLPGEFIDVFDFWKDDYNQKIEVAALLKLHAADPLHVVRPIGTVLEKKSGKQVGYFMELVRGPDVYDAARKHPEKTEGIVEQLTGFVSRIRALELVHGDIKGGNALLADDSGIVKFIDPLPINATPERDAEALRALIRSIEGLKTFPVRRRNAQ